MQKRKWKKAHYPYNPMKPKILRYSADKQIHAMVKQEYIGQGNWQTVICACKVCRVYLLQLKELNYERYTAITNPTPPLIRKQSDQQKTFSNDRFRRDNRGKTLSRFKF